MLFPYYGELVRNVGQETRGFLDEHSPHVSDFMSSLQVTDHSEPVDVRKTRALTLDNMKLQREVERLREELGQEVRQRERERKGVEQMIADGLSKASGDVASQGRYSMLL